jgi:hypothetical protein
MAAHGTRSDAWHKLLNPYVKRKTDLTQMLKYKLPPPDLRSGSVCLNSFGRFAKWISASVMPPPLSSSRSRLGGGTEFHFGASELNAPCAASASNGSDCLAD